MTMPPPTIKRPAFHVWLAPEGVDPNTATDDQLEYHHVLVHSGDQLRAELEAKRVGITDMRANPMHITVLWLWAALVRTGAYSDKFQAFKAACVSYDADRDRDAPHTDDDDQADELDAFPTEASTS